MKSITGNLRSGVTEKLGKNQRLLRWRVLFPQFKERQMDELVKKVRGMYRCALSQRVSDL